MQLTISLLDTIQSQLEYIPPVYTRLDSSRSHNYPSRNCYRDRRRNSDSRWRGGRGGRGEGGGRGEEEWDGGTCWKMVWEGKKVRCMCYMSPRCPSHISRLPPLPRAATGQMDGSWPAWPTRDQQTQGKRKVHTRTPRARKRHINIHTTKKTKPHTCTNRTTYIHRQHTSKTSTCN